MIGYLCTIHHRKNVADTNSAATLKLQRSCARPHPPGPWQQTLAAASRGRNRWGIFASGGVNGRRAQVYFLSCCCCCEFTYNSVTWSMSEEWRAETTLSAQRTSSAYHRIVGVGTRQGSTRSHTAPESSGCSTSTAAENERCARVAIAIPVEMHAWSLGPFRAIYFVYRLWFLYEKHWF